MKRNLVVFGGSSEPNDARLIAGARMLGRAAARRNMHVISATIRKGLLGQLADAVIECGGSIRGILLDQEVRKGLRHPSVADVEICSSNAERKSRLLGIAHAFVALPGGVGTLDEIFDVLVLRQVGETTKPLGLLNVANYFAPLVALVQHAEANHLQHPRHFSKVMLEPNPEMLLDRISAAS